MASTVTRIAIIMKSTLKDDTSREYRLETEINIRGGFIDPWKRAYALSLNKATDHQILQSMYITNLTCCCEKCDWKISENIEVIKIEAVCDIDPREQSEILLKFLLEVIQ